MNANDTEGEQIIQMVQKEQVNDFESSLCKERKKKEEKREKMTIDQTNSSQRVRKRENT